MLMLILTMTKNVDSQDDFYFTKWPQSPSGSFALFYPTAACNFFNTNQNCVRYAGILRTGQSVRLDCRVSAEDRISISWTLDGETVLNTSRRYQDPSTGDLIIRRADRRLDTGAFACSATNISSGFSIVSQPAVVTVLCKSQAFFCCTMVQR